MKQFIFSLFVIFYSSVSFATSCHITDENRKKWSNKYRSEVKITIKKYESHFFVSAIFPSHINGAKLQQAFFLKGKDWKKPELLFPMETGFEEEMVFTWYSIKPSLAINNFVSASYGEECGIEIVYQVEYNKKINKD